MVDIPHCSRFHHTAYPLEVTSCHHVVLTEIAGQWSVQHRGVFCLLLGTIGCQPWSTGLLTKVDRLVSQG